jgi:hypothetical protein
MPVTFNHRRILTAVLVVAFCVRLVVAYLLPDQGFPDAQGYREAGLQFWRTFHIGPTNIMPLYPILVGITGAGWGQFLLDAALSTLIVWLIDRLALVLFADHLIAIIAAAIAAIYPYFIFYAAVSG